VAWFLGQSFVVILLAFVLGLLVGWLLWGRLGRRTEARSAVAADVAADVAAEVAAEPEVDLPSEPDVDLTPEPRLVEGPVEGPAEIWAEEPAEMPAEEPAEMPAEEPAEMPAEEPAETVAPVLVADDLERIEGIGPRMAGALRQAGIHTYHELAASDEQRLRAAIEAAGLRFAPSLTTWARQARLLADGDETGFADLARRLVAGRDVGRA
jgi:predicted flap endonuclease-1-like 5' DNA nuclease